MKHTFKFAGKLFLIKLVMDILLAMLLLVVVSMASSMLLKMIVSLVAIVMLFLVEWDYCFKQAEKDILSRDMVEKTLANGGEVTKEERGRAYQHYRGFLACAIAVVPALILIAITVIVMIGSTNGKLLNLVLYFFNTSYVPFLSKLNLPDLYPNLSVIPTIPQLANTLQYMPIPSPILYLIPQLFFVLAGGIFYLTGYFSFMSRKKVARSVKAGLKGNK